MIEAVGTDIVSVARIDALVQGEGSRFLERWFSPEEIAYCTAKAHPARHLAARLAAKESVAKALRLDSAGPVPWRDIEITHDDRGAPAVRLSEALRQSLPHAIADAISVSMSHCDEFATAVAVVGGGTLREAAPLGAQDSRATGWSAAHPDPVAQALREYDALRDPHADPELEAVKAAIVLEDLAGVVLTDDQIDPAVLADANSMEALIRGLRGSG